MRADGQSCPLNHGHGRGCRVPNRAVEDLDEYDASGGIIPGAARGPLQLASVLRTLAALPAGAR